MELTKEHIEECRANPTQAMIRRAALCDLALRGLASSASATESAPFSGQTHVLKTDPVVFDAVASGHKQFEIRRNDRGFAVGDKLLLRRTRYTGAEMANGKPLDFTGETIAKIVGYMLTGPIYGLEAGWSILGFVPEWHRPQCEYCRVLDEKNTRMLSAGTVAVPREE